MISITIKASLFAASAFLAVSAVNGSAITPRQLASAQDLEYNASAPQDTGSQFSNSSDPVVYNGNSSSYYLGYRGRDFDKPYAKYWNPVVAPLSDEVVAGLTASPGASALTYSARDAHKYLTQPGYLELENGWAQLDDGTVFIAIRTEIPEVTGEAYDWWFGWHLVETQRYKLWNPVAHQYAWRYPEYMNWTNLSYRERYFDTVSFIDEYVGNNASKLSIGFVDPDTVGFNTSAWPEQQIETIVVGHIHIGDHSTTSFDNSSYLMHQVRRMDNGNRELRSRFWLSGSNHGSAPKEIAHDLAVHCNIEMTHLGTFLPAIFQEFKDTL